MRIVSLLPSATEIVFALGLGDELVGRTHECDYPPEVAQVPVLTRGAASASGLTSREIHDRVRHALHGGSSIYALDTETLTALRPDLILTQELCDVCAPSYRDVAAAARALQGEVTVLSLEPTSIEGILNTIATVGAMADAEDEAVGLIEILRERLAATEERVQRRRDEGVAPRRVVCLEWLDPPFATGHWIPEQVRRAGGWDLLGREGERAAETSWQAVLDVDPEMLLLMPCGYDALRAAEEWRRMVLPAGLEHTRAYRQGGIVALDGSAYFSRPGPRVVDGIGLLAALMDPVGFRGEEHPGGWLALNG